MKKRNHMKIASLFRYRDFRNPPSVDVKYEYSDRFWHVLAARLAFVVVFEVSTLLLLLRGYYTVVVALEKLTRFKVFIRESFEQGTA